MCSSDLFHSHDIVKVKTFVEKYDELDYKLYDIGNYFRTREQAEKVAKEIREIFEKHKND